MYKRNQDTVWGKIHMKNSYMKENQKRNKKETDLNIFQTNSFQGMKSWSSASYFPNINQFCQLKHELKVNKPKNCLCWIWGHFPHPKKTTLFLYLLDLHAFNSWNSMILAYLTFFFIEMCLLLFELSELPCALQGIPLPFSTANLWSPQCSHTSRV